MRCDQQSGDLVPYLDIMFFTWQYTSPMNLGEHLHEFPRTYHVIIPCFNVSGHVKTENHIW